MFKMALIAALTTATLSVGTEAAPVCGKRKDVVDRLSETYKEVPVGIGLAINGGFMELFAASDGATWTMIITLANGPTCLVATGHDWQFRQAAVPNRLGI